MEVLSDAPALYKILIDSYFEITPQGFETLKWPETQNVILAWQNRLENFKGESINQEEFVSMQKDIQKQCSVRGKFLFKPLRVAILGKPEGVELKKLVPLLKVLSLKKRALKVLEAIG